MPTAVENNPLGSFNPAGKQNQKGLNFGHPGTLQGFNPQPDPPGAPVGKVPTDQIVGDPTKKKQQQGQG